MEILSINDFKRLGYSAECSEEEIKFAHEHYVLPWLEENIFTGNPDLFFTLCMYSFNIYGLSLCKSDIEFDIWFSKLHTLLKRKINSIVEDINYNKIDSIENNKYKKYRFVFFLNSKNSVNEHGIYCINFLSKYEKFECHVVILGDDCDHISKLIDKSIYMHKIDFDFSGNHITDDLINMKKKLQCYKFDLAISFCSQIISTMILDLNIAKINIFFAHFLHCNMVKEGFNYQLTWGSPALNWQKFGKGYYRVIPSCLAERSNLLSNAKLKREAWATSSQIILASLGRSAKIEQLLFLQAVADILEKNQNTIWLYSSDVTEDKVYDFFCRKGLSDRIHNIGWVDLDNFLPVIDIFLDTFPVCCGITLLKALKYEKPVISINSNASYWGRDIVPLIERYKCIKYGIFPDSVSVNIDFLLEKEMDELFSNLLEYENYFKLSCPREYIEKTCELIASKSEYERVKNISLSLYNNIYSNTNLMVRSFIWHINDILCKENDLNLYYRSKIHHPSLPSSLIAISNFGRCVNRCKFCLQSHPLFSFKAGEKIVASFELFEKVIKSLPPSVEYVSCTPYSETVFEKEVINRVKLVTKYGKKSSFETSGVFYDENFFKSVFDAGLHRILISVNAPTKELYKLAHGRDNYEKVINTLNNIIILRDKYNYKFEIHIHIMLFKEFIPYYKEFYDKYSRHVDYIYGQGLCNWGNDKYLSYNFSDVGLTPLRVKNVKRYPCPSLYATLVLHPDGNYYMCGMAYNQYMKGKTIGCLGSADKISYIDAWKRLSYYRKMHAEGRWDELECCKDCNAWLNWTLYIENIKLDGDELIITEEGNNNVI